MSARSSGELRGLYWPNTSPLLTNSWSTSVEILICSWNEDRSISPKHRCRDKNHGNYGKKYFLLKVSGLSVLFRVGLYSETEFTKWDFLCISPFLCKPKLSARICKLISTFCSSVMQSNSITPLYSALFHFGFMFVLFCNPVQITSSSSKSNHCF